MSRYTAAHWGIYEVVQHDAGVVLKPHGRDPAPSAIGMSMVDAYRSPLRIQRPAVRQSWLNKGAFSSPERRGLDRFIEVPWDEALDIAADATRQTIARYGNRSIFGGSYGWSSAGRFHHAQSQLHRYLNCLGGYVRHTESYSLGAGKVAMTHVLGEMDGLLAHHTSWNVLAANCRLFVAFGGIPEKNGQASPGLVGQHGIRQGLQRMREGGTRFINVGPENTNLDTGGDVEWISLRPGTDTALVLALCHTLYVQGLHDPAFLRKYCVGFDRFLPYLTGEHDGQAKDAEWASSITTVPAVRIRALAREMASTRTVVSMPWALQRAQHGEQPFWALVTLACMLGQIGLPGGGFGLGYGSANVVGNVSPRTTGLALPQGINPVPDFIPCARIADTLLNPGARFDYNGSEYRYPDIKMVYWAGGNPFHHHQDLNRLLEAWRRPRAIMVNEQFWTGTAKLADVVFPVTSTLEREDIGYSSGERYVVSMPTWGEAPGEARDDFEVFAQLSRRLGTEDAFTEGKTPRQWQRQLYESFVQKHPQLEFPDYLQFLQTGMLDLFKSEPSHVMFGDFRNDPVAHPLKTPSGRIEIFSETVHGYGYADCPGHAAWLAPSEWLGSPAAERFPLHMLSDQPFTKLHSQLDHSSYSQQNKIAGREPVLLNTQDADDRGISDGDIVLLFNDRGSCLAGARLSDRIRRGVIKLSTGAWFDPLHWQGGKPLEKHGNPNVLTLDIGTSRLSQGCAAQTCLVQIKRYDGELPPVTAFEAPAFAAQ
jgi:biotin/methionine sulfoxide reductase